MRKLLYLIAAAMLFTACKTNVDCSVSPVELRCEYLENPSGLDDPAPRFSWTLKAADENAYGQRQTAYRILVSTSEKALKSGEADMWDSGWIESSKMQNIAYEGQKLQSDRTYFWKICVKDEQGKTSATNTAKWSTGLFDRSEWTAKWMGDRQIYVPGQRDCNVVDPWFRKSFSLAAKPAKATMFVASIGYHELYVNGKKIGDDVLAPCVTDHTKRARYVAYDIADALIKGENTIAVWLGASWSIFPGYVTDDKPRTPMVIAQADIYDSKMNVLQRIVTNETWKTHLSPNQLLGYWDFWNMGGEIYDANKEIPNWNKNGFDDSTWENATVFPLNLKLSAQTVEPNRVYQEILPVDIEERPDGSFRVDMGVNFAGWTQIKVKGSPGDRIDFLFSEREQDEMTFNNHSAYIIGQSGEGVFHNRFNYGSGRWITIRGQKTKPDLSDIKGWLVRTAFEPATTFECSDDLQNWIYDRVRWNYENLSIGGFIVDCPQRERMGYGGDAHATAETGMFNYKLGAFYSKWLEDWRDVQGTEPMVGNMNDPNWARKQVTSGRIFGNGEMPHTAPTYWGGGGPSWGGICVTLPWFIYQHYGDTRVLEENFEMIKKWLAFLDTNTENDLLKQFGGPWDFLGDWLWPNATAEGMNNGSPQTICLNNCYRVFNLRTAARIARIIGKTQDAARWEQQAEASTRAINETYYNADDFSYADKSMACLAAAFFGEVVPPELHDAVMNRLEKEIMEVRGGHIHVGITAGAMLFKVLREAGRDDLIYAMTSKTDYPSWGFMRESGATTLWEMWEKDLPGHSLLHSSYLYPGAWYIDGVAGIRRDPAAPGFNNFIVRVPHAAENITWAKASFDSPVGTIVSDWKKENGKLNLKVTVPPNSTATICIPSKNPSLISEKSGYAQYTGEKNGYAMYKVHAGKYEFQE